MKKYIIPTCFLYCGGLLNALDLKTAITEIENNKFNATILPMQFHNWPGEGQKEPKIGRADRKRFAKRMKTIPNWSGLNDEQMLLSANGKYLEYQRPTHTTTYWRQFVLFERTPGQWIMGVSAANTPRESSWSDLYFLCKVSNRWAECTEQFVPPISLQTFLKPGKILTEETSANTFLKYTITENAKLITIEVISVIPAPAYPAGEKPPTAGREFPDFKGIEFRLKWRENSLKYELEP